jgi:hypothetical protein
MHRRFGWSFFFRHDNVFLFIILLLLLKGLGRGIGGICHLCLWSALNMHSYG